ncbi:MAG: hypothetical protein IBX57_00080 [Gammaproteobacteria bacterium]|nr:hypothetical protein [Gammaproteobacteria bacterium]
MSDKQIGTLRVYGCGGMGTNVASYFNGAGVEPGTAAIEAVYIDTSRSNLKEGLAEDDVYILPNVDGSGKIRKENYQEISNVIKQILLEFVPGDFNVVVFSASGGSGSVIGPLLLGELLNRGLSAVCMVVGSDESILTAENTLKTLKSLEAIAKSSKLPVVMRYEHNDRRRSEVDNQIRLAISALAILASKQNRELDSADIANWVQFSKTTSVAPQLSMLEIFADVDSANEVKDPISVASIFKDEDGGRLQAIPEYHAAGYTNQASGDVSELHFVISIDDVPGIFGNIKKTLDQYSSQRDGRVKQASILDANDVTTDDGLVL